MPFIQRKEIDPELLGIQNQKYKVLLREALMNPGLSAEQRKSIRQELSLVGQPRFYDQNKPSKPGAL